MTPDSDITNDDTTQPTVFGRPERLSSDAPVHYTPVLICVEGPQRGTRFPITRPENVMGRSSHVEMMLKDDMASRRHVRITYRNLDRPGETPEVFVEDLDSRNGTELNGALLECSARLAERDRVLVGASLLGFFLRDENELEHDQLLYEMATRDALTGLDNRHQFKMHLAHHMERSRRNGRPVSLLIVDADRFKNINDTYGHDTGDRALIHMARSIMSCCRSSELVARWGGEEFVVLMPETGRETAEKVAERIRRSVQDNPLRLPTGAMPLTVSIGGTELGPADDSAGFFKTADQQLYRAKEAGRNRVCFDESINPPCSEDHQPTM